MAKDEECTDTQDRLESLPLEGKSSTGGKKAGAGAVAGGGGGDQKNRDFQVSKALSLLLRHKAAEAGVELDNEGFANLDKVVSSFFFYIALTFRSQAGEADVTN